MYWLIYLTMICIMSLNEVLFVRGERTN